MLKRAFIQLYSHATWSYCWSHNVLVHSLHGQYYIRIGKGTGQMRTNDVLITEIGIRKLSVL